MKSRDPESKSAGSDPEEHQSLLPKAGSQASSSGAASEQKRWQSTVGYLAALGGLCVAWLSASSGIILINRYIMRELGFSFPVALSALGQGTSFIVAFCVCNVFKLVPPADTVDSRFFLTRICPLGAAQAGATAFSNMAYLYLTVAFIEMARAGLPLFTLLGLWAARVEIPTNEHIQAVSLSGVGCGISAYGEVNLSLVGLLVLLSNFLLEIARLIMLQYLMQGQNLNPWQGLKVMMGPSCASLIVLSLFVESKEMGVKNAAWIVYNNPLTFFMAAILGVTVNYLSNSVIKIASATTLKLLAAMRGPLVVLSGVMFFKETVTFGQMVGYAIGLAGFVWHTLAKARGAAAAPPAK